MPCISLLPACHSLLCLHISLLRRKEKKRKEKKRKEEKRRKVYDS